MSAKLFFLLHILVASPVFASSDCPVNQSLTAKNMTPDGFAKWIRTNAEALKTVEDLICCLPSNYLRNYAVSFAGHLGQNGSPESPRIFVFDSTKAGSAVFTFNG